MRRLTGLFQRSRRFARPLELTERDIRVAPVRVSGATQPHAQLNATDLKALSSEVEQVADYVARLRREIAALRPGVISHDQLPCVREELANVRVETQSATDRIMAAAETLMAGGDDVSPEAREVAVGEIAMAILETCAFQDIVGQRLARASTLIGEMEKRIDRFARAVNIPDATDVFDRDSIVREMRREILLVEGPQAASAAIDQDSIDKLFD